MYRMYIFPLLTGFMALLFCIGIAKVKWMHWMFSFTRVSKKWMQCYFERPIGGENVSPSLKVHNVEDTTVWLRFHWVEEFTVWLRVLCVGKLTACLRVHSEGGFTVWSYCGTQCGYSVVHGLVTLWFTVWLLCGLQCSHTVLTESFHYIKFELFHTVNHIHIVSTMLTMVCVHIVYHLYLY